jgi:hypothetical protein
MANFPMALFPIPNRLPGYYGIPPQDMVFEYKGSSFTITKDGTGILEGNVKDAAFAILKHVISFSEIRMRPISVSQMEFDYKEDVISLKWNGTKPDFFDEMNLQFERLSKLMVFS